MDLSNKWVGGLDGKQIKQIAGSAAKLEILEGRVDDLDDLKKPFKKLEELSAKMRSELAQLTKSVDVNHQKFVAGMHDNHVASSANAMQIEHMWKEINILKSMKEPDVDLDLCDFNEHKLSKLELRVHGLEHSKAVSEIVINKKGKKMPDKKTTEEEIQDLHLFIKKLTKKVTKVKHFMKET